MPAMLKLLIVKTSSLGDVVHNLPIIHDIRKHHPDAMIDWVVEESFTDIPALHPHVHQVIPVAIRRWRKSIFKRQTWCEINHAKAQIARQHYDLIIDTQGLLKSALLTRFANGERHGYDKQSARESLASRFYQQRHHVSRALHAVARNRALAALSLGYSIPDEAPDYGIQASHPSAATFDFPFVMGLHGTSRDSKLWPVEQWVQLALSLESRQLKLLLPWSSEAERLRAEAIAKAADNVLVLPKLGISELAGVIGQAIAAVGVDTGLSHLSVALNIPTVAIYTDTDPALTGVYAGHHAPAFNLGNVGQIPSAALVMQTLEKII